MTSMLELEKHWLEGELFHATAVLVENNCNIEARLWSRETWEALEWSFRHCQLSKESFLLKIAILKMGWLSKFQSHRSEEMPILVLGRRKRPQLKRDRPKTYKFWQSPHCLNLTCPFMSWPQNFLDTFQVPSRHCLHTLEGLLIP